MKFLLPFNNLSTFETVIQIMVEVYHDQGISLDINNVILKIGNPKKYERIQTRNIIGINKVPTYTYFVLFDSIYRSIIF